MKDLGPLTPLKKVTVDGKTIELPGGTDGKFTYYDLLWLKANNLRPSELPAKLRWEIQQKFSRTVQPNVNDPLEVFNRLTFGMLSPNNPLTPNEFGWSRIRSRSMGDVDKLASYWDEIAPKIKQLEQVSDNKKADPAAARAASAQIKDLRAQVSRRIVQDHGLQAAERGGIGATGSVDYSNVAQFASWFKDNPKWFVKQPTESWPDFVERLSTQVRGLGAKVASFSSVWQDPQGAAISAIDRHMARKFLPDLFSNPGARSTWENSMVDRWNTLAKKQAAGDESVKYPSSDMHPVKNFQQLEKQSGGESFYTDDILAKLSPREIKFRLANGKINPEVPDNLKNTQWIEEPDKVSILSDTYRRALEKNSQFAKRQGLGMFSSQWSLWDAIRDRFEPHEVTFPGLYKLPKPSLEQSKAALGAHSEAGYLTSPQPVRPTENPARLAYFSRQSVPVKSVDISGLFGKAANQ